MHYRVRGHAARRAGSVRTHDRHGYPAKRPGDSGGRRILRSSATGIIAAHGCGTDWPMVRCWSQRASAGPATGAPNRWAHAASRHSSSSRWAASPPFPAKIASSRRAIRAAANGTNIMRWACPADRDDETANTGSRKPSDCPAIDASSPMRSTRKAICASCRISCDAARSASAGTAAQRADGHGMRAGQYEPRHQRVDRDLGRRCPGLDHIQRQCRAPNQVRTRAARCIGRTPTGPVRHL